MTEVLFVGLPGTGKTTYLGLLYQAIVMGRAGQLELGGFVDDRAYVNQIADALSRCEPAHHTEVEQRDGLALSLINGSEGFRLSIPDFSGETWEEVLVERSWPGALDQQVRDAAGFAVFVHADDIITDPTLAGVEAAVDAIGGHEADAISTSPGSADAGSPGDGSSRDGEPLRDMETTSEFPLDGRQRTRATQVALVDLLQLLRRRHRAPNIRVSILLSAWDRVGNVEPAVWLRDNMPLVEQYVASNSDRVQLRVWGVSAQGGDFEDEDAVSALRSLGPVERARIVAAEGTQSTVEEPIIWALGSL